jgi:hypothetical protein
MSPRVIGSAVLIVSAVLMLTGCGWLASHSASPASDVLATGPDPESPPVPRPWTVPVLEATGGLANWSKCTKLEFRGVVKAYQPDGGFYLTEHRFDVYPWSDAIQVSAREPGADLTWQMEKGLYRPPAWDPNHAVSPLNAFCREYTEAVLQITTTPVRMLDTNLTLTPRPGTVQIEGRWYRSLEARYKAEKAVSRASAWKKTVVAEPFWTQGIYFQDLEGSYVDMIWLGSPASEKYLLVRGYDYAKTADGVLVPTKIEVFQSAPDASIGPRLALVDLAQ